VKGKLNAQKKVGKASGEKGEEEEKDLNRQIMDRIPWKECQWLC
jgi:hypothetical protein